MTMEEAVTDLSLRHKHAKQLAKTEMCKFFLSSSCVKGSRCFYAHSRSELREKPNLMCTSMCKNMLANGSCSDRNCTFAHSERELRTTQAFFKTKICRFAASGRCKHDGTCRFAHDVKELMQMEGMQGVGSIRKDEIPGLFGMEGDDYVNYSQQLESSQSVKLAGRARQPGRNGYVGRPVPSVRVQDPLRSNFDWADLSSDQSTRADTSGSGGVEGITTDPSGESGQDIGLGATPEGSGESGPEENIIMQPQQGNVAQMQELTKRRGQEGRRQSQNLVDMKMERRSGEGQPARQWTTMMITNVPLFLPQAALVSIFEDLTPCMRGTFDFFYCPWDPQQDQNLGYAIVNFFSRTVASDFARMWSNRALLGVGTSKRLRIVPAALQGRAANVRHFSGFIFAHHADPRLRPLVRASTKEPLRPMAIAMQSPANGGVAPQKFPSEQMQAEVPHDFPSPHQSMASPLSGQNGHSQHQTVPGPPVDAFDCSPMMQVPFPSDMDRTCGSGLTEQLSQGAPGTPWNGNLPGQQYPVMMLPAQWPRQAWDQASPLHDEMDMQQQQQQQCFMVALPQVAGAPIGVGAPMYDMQRSGQGLTIQSRFGVADGGEYSD